MITIKENRILKELIASKNFTEKEAKKIFRKYSKMIHPDITKTDTNEDFINLKKEFEEALVVIKNPLLVENILKEETPSLENEKINTFNIRKMLYEFLELYVILGIYSQKIRIKPELKERNEKIIKKIITISKDYDDNFAILFEKFNSLYFQSFEEWYEERQLKNAKKLFINGIRKFLEYQNTGSVTCLRMAMSYLNDAYYEYEHRARSEYHENVIKLIEWFLTELDKPPLVKDS
jgi:hypothetical protein